jgi:hypothetical protein
MLRRFPTFPTSPASACSRALASRRVGLTALIGLTVLAATPAFAQRPSLLDLQAALEELVSPSPPAPVGEIVLTPVGGGDADELRLDLVDLALSAQSVANGLSFDIEFDPLRVTVPQSAKGGVLAARFLSGAPQTVRVFLPNVDSPRDPPLEVLVFQNAVLQGVEDTAIPGRIAFELSYATVTLSWGDTGWGWDVEINMSIPRPGCDPLPSGEAHVDLAGNAATQLQPGELESTHRLTLAQPPAPSVFSFTRKPANACYLRVLAISDPSAAIDMTFDRLWSQDEEFGGRQSVETIELVDVILRSWTFRIASGEVLEDVELPAVGTSGVFIGTGVQTLRDFDPATGAETSAESVLFLDGS